MISSVYKMILNLLDNLNHLNLLVHRCSWGGSLGLTAAAASLLPVWMDSSKQWPAVTSTRHQAMDLPWSSMIFRLPRSQASMGIRLRPATERIERIGGILEAYYVGAYHRSPLCIITHFHTFSMLLPCKNAHRGWTNGSAAHDFTEEPVNVRHWT